jgi:probable F420-dependent oxidoreductase
VKFTLYPPAYCAYPMFTAAWERAAPLHAVLDVARVAEASGFDALGLPDHIAMPGHSEPALAQWGPRWPDCLVAAGAVAGATSRMQVYTCVLIPAYRDPLVAAKQLATIDAISAGRLLIGIGVGALEAEFELLGVPFAARGARTDEHIRAYRELWGAERASFDGRYVSFRDVVCDPKPLQRPHPPIYIGGESDAALRRAARYGDGWHAYTVSVEDLPARLDAIFSHPAFDRDPERFEVISPIDPLRLDSGTHQVTGQWSATASLEAVGEKLARMDAAGVTTAFVYPPKSAGLAESLEWIQEFGEEVIAPRATSARG